MAEISKLAPTLTNYERGTCTLERATVTSKFKNHQLHTRILIDFLGLRLTFSNTANHKCVTIFEIRTN